MHETCLRTQIAHFVERTRLIEEREPGFTAAEDASQVITPIGACKLAGDHSKLAIDLISLDGVHICT